MDSTVLLLAQLVPNAIMVMAIGGTVNRSI